MSANGNNVVLSEFVGNKEINGAKRKYWIQVPSEDYHEEITKVMTTGFSRDEPMAKYAGNLLNFNLESLIRILIFAFVKEW